MYQWNELEKSSEQKKWDAWVIRPARKSLPMVNYASAVIFALASVVEVVANVA